MSTRLVGLSVQRFRNLPEFAVEFDSGFVIVRGPNEAGKSSLVEAVFFGLFRDAGSTAREISQAITWGLSSRPVIDLTFEADGDEYFLRRDYAAKKNLLRNTTTRDEWHDKKTIAAKVAELIGLETESLVRSTICVRAAELQRVSEAGDDLRVLLEQQVSGVGDVDLGAIGERLEKEIREIRPPRKRDVGLWRAEDEAAEARAVCDEVSQALQEQALLRADYYRGQRDLPALQSLLVEKKKSLERARAYLSIEERHETAEAVLDKALERLQSRQNAQQQRAQAATELERLAPALEAAECEVEAEAKTESERVLLGGRLEQAEKNLASLEQAVADARHAESELGAALSAIEELGAVPVQGELQRLLRLQTTILTYGDLLAAHQASVEVTAKRAVVVHIGQQRHELDRGQGVSAEVIGDLTLDIGNVAEVRVTAGGDDLKCTASDCAAMRDELERTLSGLAAGSLAELEQRVTRASELRGARRRASERLADVVGDGTVDDLAKRVDVARAGTEGLRSQLDASLADLRADARSRRNELRRALDEQTIRLNHAEGLLSGLPDEEELKREQREAAKEALKAEEGLKEHRPYELSADELGRLESEVAALDERERRLQINLGIWEGRLDGRYEATDLDAAGEALATAEARVARLRRRVAVLELVRDALAEARLTVGGNVAGLVAHRTGEILSGVTDGRYSEVQVDPQTLSIEVRRSDGEGPEWVAASSPELSTGTLDQVYLAARVALSEALAHERRPFWLLDDPLAHADSTRSAKVLTLLKTIARDRQVVLFTCHDYGGDVADQMIELGEVGVTLTAG